MDVIITYLQHWNFKIDIKDHMELTLNDNVIMNSIKYVVMST